MKNKIILTALLSILWISGFAQGPDNDWGSRMKSEKIGFITTAVGLTPEEAQSFWPVYNKISDARNDAMKKMFDAFRMLQTAMKEKKSDKEISALLKGYLEAQAEANSIDVKYVKEYEKILPSSKVARLFIAEEDFRRMQIQKLNFKDRFEGSPEHMGPQPSRKPNPSID